MPYIWRGGPPDGQGNAMRVRCLERHIVLGGRAGHVGHAHLRGNTWNHGMWHAALRATMYSHVFPNLIVRTILINLIPRHRLDFFRHSFA